MNNIFKFIIISLFSILLLFDSGLAQESKKMNKSKNGCSSGCCSGKTEMNKSNDNLSMMKLKSADKNNDGVVYECPMKCEPAQDEEGECSKCGMKLKKVSVINLKEYKELNENKMMGHSNKHKSIHNFSNLDKNKDGKLFHCPMKCEAPQDHPGNCSNCGMHLIETEIKTNKMY